MRRLAIAAVLAALTAAPAAAQESPIAALDEMVAGRDLVGWEVAWNQWRLGFPSRVPDIGNGCISDRQPAGVWFLSGNGSSTDEHVITFECRVPAGSYLFTGLPETLCSDAIPGAESLNTPRKIMRCAREGWKGLGDHAPRLVLDGTPIPNGFLVRTPIFQITLPKRGSIFKRNIRHGRAAAYAHVALIKPLAPGRHTLIQGVKYGHFHNQVLIWNLEVD